MFENRPDSATCELLDAQPVAEIVEAYSGEKIDLQLGIMEEKNCD